MQACSKCGKRCPAGTMSMLVNAPVCTDCKFLFELQMDLVNPAEPQDIGNLASVVSQPVSFSGSSVFGFGNSSSVTSGNLAPAVSDGTYLRSPPPPEERSRQLSPRSPRSPVSPRSPMSPRSPELSHVSRSPERCFAPQGPRSSLVPAIGISSPGGGLKGTMPQTLFPGSPHSPLSPSYNSTSPVSPTFFSMRSPGMVTSPRSPTLTPHNKMSSMPLPELAPYQLSSVVSNPMLRNSLEDILQSTIKERKDLDNSLKRLWIFQHLVETPCRKCCFIMDGALDDKGKPQHRFRIKSKCLAHNFRVSGNTPFNWLVRDFCRVHAPHSSHVPERKDLREVYYDGFGLFKHDMCVGDFVQLSTKLSGRPTSKKRKAEASASPVRKKVVKTEKSSEILPVLSKDVANTNTTSKNLSRLVLQLKVSNKVHLLMHSQGLNMQVTKTTAPLELPTLRPELGKRYEFGRMDANIQKEPEKKPNKFFISDIGISRNHMEVTYTPQGWYCLDQGSTLGTTVKSVEVVEVEKNGEKVMEDRWTTTKLRANVPHKLQARDVISLSEGVAVLSVASLKHLESTMGTARK